MTHSELDLGLMRAFTEGTVTPEQAQGIPEHLSECIGCRATLAQLKEREASVRSALEELQDLPSGPDDLARGWAAFERRRDGALTPRRSWSAVKAWWVAAGMGLAACVLLLSIGSTRGWAQQFLAIFRVEHFTVLEVNPEVGNSFQNNQMLNQAISRMLSDQVKVTQQPQPPRPLAGEQEARTSAGFAVRFLPGLTATKLTLESGAAAQFTLSRDRLQTILDEAGRSDLQMPASVDGAVVSFRISPGVMATYDQCLNGQLTPMGNTPCITLMQVPSPVVSAPQGFNPAQLAQVGLQFLGMTEKDAADFTRTVDWTSTLVLPVMPGSVTYKQIPVGGAEGVLLRHAGSTGSDRYTLTWVSNGIVTVIESYGDDDAAVSLAEQLT